MPFPSAPLLPLALLALTALAPAGGRAQALTPASAEASTPAQAPLTPGSPALGPREKQVLEKIRQMKVPRWRSYGVCRYDWAAWRLSGGGVRVTAAECGEPPVASSVAVHCDTLRVTRRLAEGSPWDPWRLPFASGESTAYGGEDLMVASLCANVTNTPAPAAGAKPQPGSPPPLPAKAR
jgi:hypothetical protein